MFARNNAWTKTNHRADFLFQRRIITPAVYPLPPFAKRLPKVESLLNL